jgi:hypothetical protein
LPTLNLERRARGMSRGLRTIAAIRLLPDHARQRFALLPG